MTPEQLQLFDPGEETTIIERRLPHWHQTGTITFITWRTHDSMPKPVIERWQQERQAWLIAHGVSGDKSRFQESIQALSPAKQREFQLYFRHRWMDMLDECHGSCELSRPALASIVANSLRHFDGKRYLLTDYVVMPNHVHLLVAFPDQAAMLAQCESWKHFTATQINLSLGRQGRFWQPDGFDHLVRSESQFRALRQYLRDNPQAARLQPGEYLHYARSDV